MTKTASRSACSILPALSAAALAAAMTSAPAAAADVQIYGLLDYGFSLSRYSGTPPEADRHWNFEMKSGMRNSSRFGFRGSEDLAGGWKVSFTLESQFLGDSGTFQTAGTLWERESSVAVSGPIGKFTFGRTGQLKSPIGTTGLAGTIVNPFGSAMSNFIGGLKYVTAGNYFPVNNAITWQSPDMKGLTAYLQYSLANTDEGSGCDDDDRSMAAALRYRNGPLLLTFIADTINLKHQHDRSEQPSTLNFAASYDFGFIKPYAYVQFFRSGTLNTAGSYIRATGDHDGAGGILALQWPMLGGKAKAGVSGLKAEASRGEKNDITRWTAAVGYDTEISRTFHFYANLGFMEQTTETADAKKDLRGTEITVGAVKYF